MKVLFTTTPGRGHMHPMVPLAKAFAERGDQVMWAASSELVADLRQAGFEATSCGLAKAAPPVGALPFGGMPNPAQFQGGSAQLFMRTFGDILIGPMLDDLVPIVESFRPDLIVHETAEFAAPIAAAIAGIPCITHAVGRAMPLGRISQDEQYQSKIAGHWQEYGLEPRQLDNIYEDVYLDIYPSSLQSEDTGHMKLRQPLRPVPYASGDATMPEWDQRHAELPLVFLTFGTAVPLQMTPIETALKGLAELPIRLLASVPTGDPDQFGSQPENVRLAKYIPTTKVIEECSLVVSHGGAGIMLSSLAYGIPQLLIPQMADQFKNAADCERTGAALVLDRSAVTVESVQDCATQLLDSVALRSAAQRIQSEISEMPSPSEVVDTLSREAVAG